ncbi:hypothetical protein J4573_41010 [Actinomadura barringtoniae]|uniref:DUF6458 domain-containing protein n=1 Tax=Actinomadura barringtoniae TaxID=1427535 RepID=A0A939PJN0_9ACTN|nr:DUF6458 family protein [Actinomadura barringtoniae]MBO2453527.1 hypothetical protein [Actinomadura barringtoniae]
MGLGVSIAFITLGAILTFAVRVNLSGVDIHVVGLILILAGALSMAFTLMYTRPRQRRNLMTGADPGYFEPEQPDTVVQESSPETVVHEERTIEQTPHGPVEHIERTVERPGETIERGHTSQDPAIGQDPAIQNDPAKANIPSPTIATSRRAPHERRP